MREIKFRAWDKINKEMLEDYPAPDDYGDINNIFYSWADEYIPLQYTGLKDKNGKEIYEGDVLKYKYCGLDCPEEEFEYMEVKWDTDLEDGFCGFEIPASWAEFIVIGNIYENPELLSNAVDKEE